MAARTLIWRGDAAAVAQVNTLCIAGTVAAGDTLKMTIGSKTLSVLAGATNTHAVANTVASAWNLLTQTQAPEFFEVTALCTTGGVLTLTAKTAGKPFTCVVTNTDLASDDLVFNSNITTANAGPNDVSSVNNWYVSGINAAGLPITGDTLVFENGSVSALYGLNTFASNTMAALHVSQSFSGYIGLPRTNGTGTSAYSEYRTQYLQVGATIWDVGLGEGSGSGRIKLDCSNATYTGTVYNAGSQAESYVPSVLLLGTNTHNTLTVLKGTVGVEYFAGELSVNTGASAINTTKIGYVSSVVGDANVWIGSGVVLNSGGSTIVKSGGQLTFGSNALSFTQYDGTTTVQGSAAITAATVGGTLIDQSSGTIGTLTMLAKGMYDHSKSMVAKTVSAFVMNAGAVYKDPYGVVTLTAGAQLNACKPADVTLDIAAGHTLSIS
jgi:hypothetical protein